MKTYDVIVIGGGAAGLFCALTAGQRGRSVLVLDSSNKVGKKILMSGGGGCNFTNLDITPENYLSQNPHFCISALNRVIIVCSCSCNGRHIAVTSRVGVHRLRS